MSKLDPDDRIVSGEERVDDLQIELTLRPERFAEFIGQAQIKENLRIYIEAARNRKDVLDHILFSGLPGLGKTTLAHIISREFGAEIKETTGPALEKPAQLVGILTNLNKGDILFIDEIHRLGTVVEEYLYSAMEDFVIDIVLDQGPAARSMRIPLERFTLIGATTREGLLTSPFRARFGIREKLDFYPPEDIEKIVRRSARILDIEMKPDGSQLIAASSRGTPRIANRFLRRVRDVAQVKGDGVVTAEMARMGLDMLGVDKHGLDRMDRKILKTIIDLEGGPVGLKTVAVSVGEEEDTIEDVYEPYLIQQALLMKTPRGRKVTPRAYEVLGEEYRGDNQTGLF